MFVSHLQPEAWSQLRHDGCAVLHALVPVLQLKELHYALSKNIRQLPTLHLMLHLQK
jgi:hypothetical protein